MAVSKLDLMMAGTADAVLMIEGFCDWLTEEQMLEVRVMSKEMTRRGTSPAASSVAGSAMEVVALSGARDGGFNGQLASTVL